MGRRQGREGIVRHIGVGKLDIREEKGQIGVGKCPSLNPCITTFDFKVRRRIEIAFAQITGQLSSREFDFIVCDNKVELARNQQEVAA